MTPTPERPAPDFEGMVHTLRFAMNWTPIEKPPSAVLKVSAAEKALLAAILAVQEERDAFKENWNGAERNANKYCKWWDEAARELTRLTAENARLRAAPTDDEADAAYSDWLNGNGNTMTAFQRVLTNFLARRGEGA